MKGILFKPWKIKAIADSPLDREWMTRRVIKPQPNIHISASGVVYGNWRCKPSETILWASQPSVELITNQMTQYARYQVGETVYIKEAFYTESGDIWYKSDGQTAPMPIKWHSPLFMPAWTARYFIQITNVQVQRLQEITEEDIKAEGIESGLTRIGYYYAYGQLWDSINKPPYDWASNPWVLVYSFMVALEP